MTGRNIMQDVFEKQNDERLLISVQEACRLTGVCEKTMRNLLYENNLQVRIGRSEEHTSELQSRFDLVCLLLLEKKKCQKTTIYDSIRAKHTVSHHRRCS